MDESSTAERRAPLSCQRPTAEAGCDTQNHSVECVTMVVDVFLFHCVFSVYKCMDRNESAERDLRSLPQLSSRLNQRQAKALAALFSLNSVQSLFLTRL